MPLPLLALLDHGHVAVVVEEDDLELVVAVGDAGDDEAGLEVLVAHLDAVEVGVLALHGAGDGLAVHQGLHGRQLEPGNLIIKKKK